MKKLTLGILLPFCAACSNPAKDIVIHSNPDPVHAYILTLDASHAPGPIQSPKGYISFENDYSGRTCMPKSPPLVEWRMSGKRIDFELKPVEGKNNVFESIIYLDALKDENYFGKGMCLWRMNMAGVGFVGQGGLGYGAGIGYTKFKDGEEDTAYYPVSSFTETTEGKIYPIAPAVPTNDFKLDPENSYVNDATKYFPIYIRVKAKDGSPGLSVMEEYEQRKMKHSK